MDAQWSEFKTELLPFPFSKVAMKFEAFLLCPQLPLRKWWQNLDRVLWSLSKNSKLYSPIETIFKETHAFEWWYQSKLQSPAQPLYPKSNFRGPPPPKQSISAQIISWIWLGIKPFFLGQPNYFREWIPFLKFWEKMKFIRATEYGFDPNDRYLPKAINLKRINDWKTCRPLVRRGF